MLDNCYMNNNLDNKKEYLNLGKKTNKIHTMKLQLSEKEFSGHNLDMQLLDTRMSKIKTKN